MTRQPTPAASAAAEHAKDLRRAAARLREAERIEFRSWKARGVHMLDVDDLAGMALLSAIEAGLVPQLAGLLDWWREVRPPGCKAWFTRCGANLLREAFGDVRALMRLSSDGSSEWVGVQPEAGQWAELPPTRVEEIAQEPLADPAFRSDADRVRRLRYAEGLDSIAAALERIGAQRCDSGSQEPTPTQRSRRDLLLKTLKTKGAPPDRWVKLVMIRDANPEVWAHRETLQRVIDDALDAREIERGARGFYRLLND